MGVTLGGACNSPSVIEVALSNAKSVSPEHTGHQQGEINRVCQQSGHYWYYYTDALRLSQLKQLVWRTRFYLRVPDLRKGCRGVKAQIDGLMQKRRNSIANALELRIFCIKLSKCERYRNARALESLQPLWNHHDHVNRKAAHCPASRTTLVATRFWVVMICPIIKCLTVLRVFFHFVWFVFIHHNFQFYFELCTYCNILDIYLS